MRRSQIHYRGRSGERRAIRKFRGQSPVTEPATRQNFGQTSRRGTIRAASSGPPAAETPATAPFCSYGVVVTGDQAQVLAKGVAVLEQGRRYSAKAEALLKTAATAAHRTQLQAALDQLQAALRNLQASINAMLEPLRANRSPQPGERSYLPPPRRPPQPIDQQ